jgi:hypothetical protein
LKIDPQTHSKNFWTTLKRNMGTRSVARWTEERNSD